MRIKALLLGSAAAFTVVGAANAADTVKPAQVVKPVNYVQVCDAYGLGYFVIPGQKDTCLRVQGSFSFQINFHTRDTEFWSPSTTSWHEAGWDTQENAKLTFTAKRMTDHGDLTGVIQLTGTSYGANNIQGEGFSNLSGRVPVSRYVQLALAYVKLGGFEVGYDNSVYGIGTTNQLSYTFNLGGGTQLQFGVDDSLSRWGSRLPRYVVYPDFVGNINGAASWGTWGFGAAYQGQVTIPQSLNGNGPTHAVWGVNGKVTINTPAIAKGDQLAFSGSVGDGCAFVVNNCGNGTSDGGLGGAGTVTAMMWQALGSFKHVFNPSLNSTVSFQWIGEPGPIAAGKATAQWAAKDAFVWQGLNDKNYQVSTFVQAAQSVGATSHGGVIWSGQVQFAWSY